MADDKYYLVEEDYDNVEETFHNQYDAVTEFHEQIASFLSNLKPDASILNIGGTLAECVYFLNKELNVTDVDISQSIIDYISKREPRVKTIKANIKNFDTGNYDGIWACRSLIHIPPDDIGVVLRKLYSLLYSDGTVGCIFFTSQSTDITIDEKPEQHTNKPDTTYYCVMYPPDIIKDRFIKAGFTIKKTESCVDKDGDMAIYIEAQK